MRNTILFTILAASFSLSALANQTPAERNCRAKGGSFWILDVDASNFELCRFGEAAIGDIDLLDASNGDSTEAVSAYLNPQIDASAYSATDYCEAVGGNATTLSDTNGQSFDLCVFGDVANGQGIELNTLKAGANAAQNARLTDALR